MSQIWTPVHEALDRAASHGRLVDVWLRDDDAVSATPALDRLATVSLHYALPILLAVIPQPADRSLVEFLSERPSILPTQHGFSHANHAARGERARELGGRPLAVTLDDLTRGRDKLRSLFGADMADILVPPWNRIDADVLPHLGGLGFDALSTFGSDHVDLVGLDRINANLDIIDWRNGRTSHPHEKLADKLAVLIESGGPIGLLTHHLAHDEATWLALDQLLASLASHPTVRFGSVDQIRRRGTFAPRGSSSLAAQ